MHSIARQKLTSLIHGSLFYVIHGAVTLAFRRRI